LPYLLTRVLAYALSYEEGIEFSPTGLGDPDVACIRVADPSGNTRVWIEVGNPSARKIHKASKASPKLKIYTYKDPQVLLNEMASESIHRRDQIEVFRPGCIATKERKSLDPDRDGRKSHAEFRRDHGRDRT
jgi:uncharacterized protein YaeQ